MGNDEIKHAVEALLFASEKPLTAEQIKEAFSASATKPADPSSGGEASIRRCAKPSQGFPYALFYVYGVN